MPADGGPAPVVAIVLAAGRSRRMGRPKALLDLGGEPALARVLRVLREVPLPRIVVVLRPDDAAAARAVDLEGVVTALNVAPDADQTSSLRIALQNVEPGAAAFLVCPVDVPFFEAEDVRALLAAFAARPAGATIVVPSHGGRRGHPALFARGLAAEFLALRDGEPAHSVVRRDPERVVHVARNNAELVLDLDTPEDVARALGRRGAG